MEDLSSESWIQEVVRLRPLTGRIRYLVHVHRERCGNCSTGTRTVSIWAATRGKGETITWCSHCFDATCETIVLAEEHQDRYQTALSVEAREGASQPWTAVRPAVEDLERRGLL